MTKSTDTPLTASELDVVYTRLGVARGAKLLVAVSGGADSMALALLTNPHRQVEAVTVDHGLREGSADEAKQVAIWLRAAGISHRTICWQGDKPSTGIQAAARAARYELLHQQAQALGCDFIVVGHHVQDQAETFMLRLARGSGLQGLGAMAELADVPSQKGEIKLLRPLLNFTKSKLEAALKHQNQSWIEDPSNRDISYDRVKVRQYLAAPTLDGLTNERLAHTAASLQRANAALLYYEQQLFGDAVEIDLYGTVCLQINVLRAAPEEVSMRLFSRLLQWFTGANYAPRFEKIESLFASLSDKMTTRTLAGVCVKGIGSEQVIMHRELAVEQKSEGPIASDEIVAGRWRMIMETQCDIGPLGEDGVQQLRQFDKLEAIPNYYSHQLCCSMLALWQEGRVEALIKNGKNATLLPVFIAKQ